jgi:phenylacetate-CoA ligase
VSTATGPAPASAAYEARCREALSIALEQTEVYAAWRSRDPGPDAALDARYAALPVLTKDDLRAHFPYGLVPRGRDLDAALARGEVSFVSTSGTADEALQNIWNQAWWDASERASWRLNAVAARAATGAHHEAILASALSVGPRSRGAPLDPAARRLGRLLFLNEFGRTEEWPEGHEERIVSEIAGFQPPVLEANPSLLARVARWALKTGKAVWQPELVTLTYEYPSEVHLRAIRQVLRCPIASSYGSTEAGYVFMECEHGSLHQNAETCRVDLIPLAGVAPGPDPRGTGSVGRILASTFGNDWFPLLRFEIGDLARVASAPCPCGRRLGLTLEAVEGRTASVCRSADGRLFTHRTIDLALAAIDGLELYRLDQEYPDLAHCHVVAASGAGARVVRDARDTLCELLGAGVRLDVTEAHALFPEASGKFLLVRRWFPLGERSHA